MKVMKFAISVSTRVVPILLLQELMSGKVTLFFIFNSYISIVT